MGLRRVARLRVGVRSGFSEETSGLELGAFPIRQLHQGMLKKIINCALIEREQTNWSPVMEGVSGGLSLPRPPT